jgi:hypothetical protein
MAKKITAPKSIFGLRIFSRDLLVYFSKIPEQKKDSKSVLHWCENYAQELNVNKVGSGGGSLEHC